MSAQSRQVRDYLLLPLVVTALFMAGCTSNSPLSPTPAGLGGPGSTERRVGSVGGGDDVCVGEEDNEAECLAPGTFTIEASNGDTLVGSRDTGPWEITGGTGRFTGATGFTDFVSFSPGALDVRLNFVVPGASPPILSTGTLQLTGTTQRVSTDCASGTAVVRTFEGVLESLGRVNLQVDQCLPE